jgi:hypothetical protein
MFKRVERLTDFDLEMLPRIKGLHQVSRFEMSLSRAAMWPDLFRDSSYAMRIKSFEGSAEVIDSIPFGVLSDGEREVLVVIDVDGPLDFTQPRSAWAYEFYAVIRCLPGKCDVDMVRLADNIQNVMQGVPAPPPR